MKSSKYVKRTEEDIERWIWISNQFAFSMLDYRTALQQFNALTVDQKILIRKRLQIADEKRREHYPQTIDESLTNDAYVTSVMVDAHIIATELGMDPLVVVMCVKPICGLNEKIIYVGR